MSASHASRSAIHKAMAALRQGDKQQTRQGSPWCESRRFLGDHGVGDPLAANSTIFTHCARASRPTKAHPKKRSNSELSVRYEGLVSSKAFLKFAVMGRQI